MANPQSGPFTKLYQIPKTNNLGKLKYYSNQTIYKQAKPYDQVLPYKRQVAQALLHPNGNSNGSVAWDAGYIATAWWTTEVQLKRTDLANRAYDRIKSKMYDEASLGTALAELGQSVGMVSRRAAELLLFAKALRKLDFAGAARILKMAFVPQGASAKKSFSSNWLEFHFGWSPMVGDIYSAIDVLQSPIKSTTVKTRVQTGLLTQYYVNSGSGYLSDRKWDGVLRVQMGTDVAVTNPNQHLANQLGLINPAVIAWELVPFSFVADWFVNVQQFLASGTDFLGLTLTRSYTTVSALGIASMYQTNPNWATFELATGTFSYTERYTSLWGPVLKVRPFKLWGWKRCLTSVALLTQKFGR